MSDQDSYPSQARPTAPVNLWLVLILIGLVGVFVYQRFVAVESPVHDPNAAAREVTPRGDLASSEKSTIALFRKCQQSVVHIRTADVQRDNRLELVEVAKGSGSGLVWHIVTNFHVIKDAQNYYVTLFNNKTYPARYVGGYAETDLAVVKIDAPAETLVPIEIGQSDDLQVGQSVFAIGNPFGLFSQTLTTGVVSGLGRTIPAGENHVLRDLIQTDAAINPGNSGGPLLDSYGRLIGINTAIFSPSGTNLGLGFAVPVDTVNQIVPQLIQHGRVDRPGLGIQIFPDSFVDSLRENRHLDRHGVLILDIVAGGAAEKAGLQPTRRDRDGTYYWGDLIVQVDDKPIKRQSDLFKALSQSKVGDTIQVVVIRDGQEIKAELTLQALRTRAP
ncbi:MAG: trypsin-like peptidase domain-containing protein [Planctomycetota bacterium]|nr:trypsin-like peptidase domain-containing protein [Planctomycetota bacterium]